MLRSNFKLTVLLVFFSLLENPDLLNLCACQTHPKLPNEKKIIASSWMKSLGHALDERLDSDVSISTYHSSMYSNWTLGVQ